MRLSTTKPHRLTEFLSIHHLGVKALAMHDDEMLRLVERWWPMETNVGRMTLADFRERYGVVRYSASTDQFRQLAAVAAAQDIALINAGYTYDTELIERLAQVEPSAVVERLDPSDLATRFEPLDPDRRSADAAVRRDGTARHGPAGLRGHAACRSSRPGCRRCT